MWTDALGNNTTHVMFMLCAAGALIVIVASLAAKLALNWYKARKNAIEAYTKDPTPENKQRMEASQKWLFPVLLVVSVYGLTCGIVALTIDLIRYFG